MGAAQGAAATWKRAVDDVVEDVRAHPRAYAVGVPALGATTWLGARALWNAVVPPSPKPRTTFSALLPQLDSGDVVLTRGGGVVSTSICVATRAPYSHVAMVLRDDSGALWSWDATLARDDDDPWTAGPALLPLSELRETYAGTVAAVVPLHTGRRAAVAAAIRRVARERRWHSPHMNFVGWAAGALGAHGVCSALEDPFATHCAQLTAESLVRAGILHKRKPPSAYTPADFHPGSGAELEWACGDRLGKPVVVLVDDVSGD
jgi:hypothetical protein